MSDFYTLPGIPSDTLDSVVVGERNVKANVQQLRRAVDQSGSIREINIEHGKVHDGLAYISEFMVYLSGTTEQNFIFQTGQYPVHMKEVEAIPDNDEVAVAMFEDTISTGGAQQTFTLDGIAGLSMQPIPLNRARDTFPCGCSILAAPTITQQGVDHLFIKFMPGVSGTGQNSSGSMSQEDWERLLKLNHRYHLWVKRLEGTGTTRVKLKFKYYIVVPSGGA
jgi:hypothetical protein